MDPMDRLVSVAAATAPGTRRFVTVAAALFDDDDPAGALAALRSALDAWARTVDGTTETMPTGQRIARLTAQGVLPVSAAEHAQRILARTEATRSPSAADAADAADALASLITGTSTPAATARSARPPMPGAAHPQPAVSSFGAIAAAALTAAGMLSAGVWIGQSMVSPVPTTPPTAPADGPVATTESNSPAANTSTSPSATEATPTASATLLNAGTARETPPPLRTTPVWYSLPHEVSQLRLAPDPAAKVVARLGRGAKVQPLRETYPNANPNYAYIANDDIEYAPDGRTREIGAFTVVKIVRQLNDQTSLVTYANAPHSAPLKVPDTSLVNFEAQSWFLVRTEQGVEGWIFGGLMPSGPSLDE